MKKISIVVTTFNDSKEITHLLDDLYLNQTYKVDEIVISDGGSKDDTVKIIKNYKKKHKVNIKIISDGVRRNIAEGINIGIKKAKNDWILIVGTGNKYLPTYVEKLVNELYITDKKVIYGSFLGLEQGIFSHIFNQYFLRGNKDNSNFSGNHGNLIHRSIFEKYGYFWENFVYAGEDTEFALRLKKNGVEFQFVPNNPLYWITPSNIKEYLKKMEVCAIADWQIFSKKNVLIKDLIFLFFLFTYILFCIFNTMFLLLLIPLFLFVGYKKRTINIFSIFLGLFTKYLMFYYHLKFMKYSNIKYHVKC